MHETTDPARDAFNFARAAAWAVAVVLAAGCGNAASEAAPPPSKSRRPHAPKVDASGLCVTKGHAAIGARVTDPTVRAVQASTSGDAAALTFRFRGDSATSRALASGQRRRQLGLKLRAQDGCNLVYVMWRLDPRPMLEVSVKRNPGKRTNEQCGTDGYTKVRPATTGALPAITADAIHTLRAQIAGDELRAYVDDRLAWRGALPAAARGLAGPAGLRSDNVTYDLVAFDAARGPRGAPEKCGESDAD